MINKKSQKTLDLSLTPKENIMLGIQAAIQAIPYVGGSIATLYFGYKQEIRFKRLETFYKSIPKEIEEIKERIKDIKQQDEEAFVYILEALNEKVEKEFNEKKIRYLKNFFKKTLIDPINKTNFDERKFFLESLDSITTVEIEILGFLFKKSDKVQLKEISLPHNTYIIVGGVERLKSYGFLESSAGSFRIGNGIDNRLIEKLNLSDFGISFYKFCIE